MSDEKPSPDPNEETTLLHLDQFKPGQDAKVEGSSSEEGMTVFIKKAAAETTEKSEQPVIVPKDASALPPKEMLGAVAYCYAKGVYESDKIERKMLDDPALHAALGDKVPDAKAIRRFRRLNLPAIKDTLEKAFRLKRRKDKQDLQKPLPGQPEPEHKPVASAVDGEGTIFFARKEAEQKVENAMIIDNMSKEP